jgi:aryl-alcohol dehydrogenase-like predicted oxidoreductase
MDHKMFGRTDLRVSSICFGTWPFGGDCGDIEIADPEAAGRTALALGINFSSLRNLGTDDIDFLQVHWPDPATPFTETAAAHQFFAFEQAKRREADFSATSG